MDFFAHNGFYEAERKIGNRYSIDLEIETNFESAGMHDDLSKTINYETLYKIVESEIHKQSKLLEHIVHNINRSAFNQFDTIKSITTTVCKKNPPFGGLCEEVCITDTISRSISET